jgi:hypothetical protein
LATLNHSEAQHCQRCFIPAGLLLLDDYFPVSAAYAETLSTKAQQRITVVALKEGVCLACHLYETHYDRRMLLAERQLFLDEVTPQNPALLALSGGKDSLTALYLLADVLKVPTRAFLYQNGFIPAEIVVQAQNLCDRYGVDLIVVEDSLVPAFEQEYTRDRDGKLQALTGLDFCRLCSTQVHRVGLELSAQYNSRWMVFGNKVYTELEPYVSSIKMADINGHRHHSINLLYTLGIQTAHQNHILKAMNWKDPGLAGYTSNCLIPGLVAEAREKKLKMHADQGYIERELRSGAYNRQEALQLLNKTASHDS